jgi:hypothetical protein
VVERNLALSPAPREVSRFMRICGFGGSLGTMNAPCAHSREDVSRCPELFIPYIDARDYAEGLWQGDKGVQDRDARLERRN